MQLYPGKSTAEKKNPPYSVFLSWQNTWHEWGNSQADALLDAGRVLKNEKYISHALLEINEFYPYLVKNNYLNEFSVEAKSNHYLMTNVKKYSQIAYGIRPMVFASLNAYKITGNKKYAKIASELSGWFFGKNPAKVNMYNPENGICFDGIIDSKTVNKNSGAESTIEALLTMIEIENMR